MILKSAYTYMLYSLVLVLKPLKPSVFPLPQSPVLNVIHGRQYKQGGKWCTDWLDFSSLVLIQCNSLRKTYIWCLKYCIQNQASILLPMALQDTLLKVSILCLRWILGSVTMHEVHTFGRACRKRSHSSTGMPWPPPGKREKQQVFYNIII